MKNLLKNIKEEKEKIDKIKDEDSLSSSIEPLIFEDFRPKLIKEDTNNILENFGITEDRGVHLIKIILDVIKNNFVNNEIVNIPNLIMQVCDKATHPNEIVFMVFTLSSLLTDKTKSYGG